MLRRQHSEGSDHPISRSSGAVHLVRSAALVGLLALLATPELISPRPAISREARPWGASGHRIVAQIGYQHLDSLTRAAVADILGPGELTLARAATWPDEIRSDTSWNAIAPWHFLTVEDGADYREHVRERAALDSVRNVAEAIHFFTAALGGDAGKLAQLEDFARRRGGTLYRGSARAAALSLLVHFVGDVHQPLHVGRGGDRGGNSITVNWFEERTNLHTVWDERLIQQQELSFSELARMIDHPTAEQVRQWTADPPGRWIEESIALRGQVYDTRRGDAPSTYLGYGYAYRNSHTVDQRLLQGGVRLAGVLESILR